MRECGGPVRRGVFRPERNAGSYPAKQLNWIINRSSGVPPRRGRGSLAKSLARGERFLRTPGDGAISSPAERYAQYKMIRAQVKKSPN